MILRGRRADAVPFFCPHPAALRHWGTRTGPAAHPAQSPSGVRREAKRPPPGARRAKGRLFRRSPRCRASLCRFCSGLRCRGPCLPAACLAASPAPGCTPAVPPRLLSLRPPFPHSVRFRLPFPLHGQRRAGSPRMDGRPVSSCPGRSMRNVSQSIPAWTFSVIRFTVINAQIN